MRPDDAPFIGFPAGASRRRQVGVGLVESMVALAIAALLLASALFALSKTRAAQRAFDARARMQETAWQSLALIESDLRMAGYHGLSLTVPTDDATLSFPDKCGGVSWVAADAPHVDGHNGVGLARPNCAASGGGFQPGSDALILRRASAGAVSLAGTKVPAAMRERVLLVSRYEAAALFVADPTDGLLPTGYDLAAGPSNPLDLREWLVNAYYVSRGSSIGASVPGLRRKTLQVGPSVGDEEIAAGVEDLQVTIGADVDGDGTLDAHFAPGTMPVGARPVCVRVWLRVVALERDNPPGGAPLSNYADRVWPAVDDGRSRLLLSKTVFLRNP